MLLLKWKRERENYSITFSKLGNSVLYLYFFSLSSSAFIKVQEFYKSLELAGKFPARGKARVRSFACRKKKMIAGCVSSLSLVYYWKSSHCIAYQTSRLQSVSARPVGLRAERAELSGGGQDEEELEAVVVGPSASFKPAAAKACTLGQAYNQNLSKICRNLNVGK